MIKRLLHQDSWNKVLEGRYYFQSMCLHKEAFAAIVQTKVESHTKYIDPLLLIKLLKLRKSSSPALVEDIMRLDDFKDIKQCIVSATGNESPMTIKYLKDVSRILALVFALKEGGLKRHFSAKQEISKLMFAFNHINFAGYITYQHVYLNNLCRKDRSVVKDLVTIGQGASCSTESFSAIRGDLTDKYFKKKRQKLLAFSPQVIVLIFVYAVCKWIKTLYFHSKVRTLLEKKLNVSISQIHKEMTLGNKRLHFEHAWSLKASLKL